MKKKIYISGAITGLSIDEFTALFSIAESALTDQGYVAINPVTIDHDHDKSWEAYMLNDIKALFACDAMYMLSNWKQSRGARIEHAIGIETGKKIFYQ